MKRAGHVVGARPAVQTRLALGVAHPRERTGSEPGLSGARDLSRATNRNIRQNLAFAFLYNALGVPIAAGLLYPLFGWLLNPMLAAAAMSLSSLSVITNALRLRP